jgi:hypothetical protein
MGEAPQGMTLERKNSNKGYSLDNCCWASPTTQNRNRRNVSKYEHDGLNLTLPEWAEQTKIPYGVLAQRIRCLGWSIGRALTTPLRGVARYTHDGLSLTLTEWADRLGISRRTLEKRLALGWPTERMLTTS